MQRKKQPQTCPLENVAEATSGSEIDEEEKDKKKKLMKFANCNLAYYPLLGSIADYGGR